MANIVSQSPSVSEVKAVLAETSNSVGGLCTSSKINKWSKWKPIRRSKVADIDETDLYAVNYGISLPVYANVSSMIDEMSGVGGVSPVWGYNKPTGGASSPYRLGDFRNYNKNAVAPIGGVSMTNRAAINGGNKEITGFILMANGNDYQIGWEDLNLEGRKLGIALKSTSNNNIYTSLSASDGSSNVSINVVTKSIPQGFYSGFLFLTNEIGGTGNIIGLNNHPRRGFRVEVTMQYVTVSISARWQVLNPNKLDINVSAINTTGSPVNLLGCILNVRFSQNDIDDTYQQYEIGNQVDSTITVPPTNQLGVSIFDKSINVLRDENPSWKVCWRNGGVYPNEWAVSILTPRD